MVIFRFSAIIVLASVSGACSKNMPPADTELGRIARISDVAQTEEALVAYAQHHFTDRDKLRASLEESGFNRSVDKECEIFRWRGKGWGSLFPKVMIVSVCGNRVEASAGYVAP